MLVTLEYASSIDQGELYLEYGAPPTRADYQFHSSSLGTANQQIVVPSAAPGTWYVLVYDDNIPAPSTFSLTAAASSVFLTGLSPATSGTITDTTMILTGAGFNSATTVTLVSAGGTAFPVASTSLDSPTRLSATIPAGSVPAGRLPVQVTQTDGSTSQLPGVFTMIQGGQGTLKTNLILPSLLGFHTASTLYLQYSNVGNAPMPAPLLEVTATDGAGDYGAAMGLSQSQVVSGIWTSANPITYSNSIQLLASGATPGLLEPGESIQVPIYWVGWHGQHYGGGFDFTVGVLDPSNTTPIDWNSVENSSQPSNISAGAWQALYPALVSQLGSTWGEYLARMDSDAAVLAGLGENVTNLSDLGPSKSSKRTASAQWASSPRVSTLRWPCPARPWRFLALSAHRSSAGINSGPSAGAGLTPGRLR